MAILTVTLNPAIDRETTTETVVPGEKLRCAAPTRDPGGGGINVARAIVQLGGTATALIAGSGPTGEALAGMLAERGVPVGLLPAPGDVRENLAVREQATGRQFRFILPGPTWQAEDVAALSQALSQVVGQGDWLVVSGSLPPGVDPTALGALCRRIADQGAHVVLDTSGPALAAMGAGGAGLALLRMNREEAESLAGHPLPLVTDSAAFAADLVARGVARMVIMARGAEGSVLAAAGERWSVSAADVPIVSRTGAGDSFVAGAVMALDRGVPLDEVLRHASAAASAAVTTPATDLCDRDTMERLLPLCQATPI
jgi:6-phosphofructokinase 2